MVKNKHSVLGRYTYLSLFGVVRIEGHTLNHQTVGKKEDCNFANIFKAFNTRSDCCHLLLLCDEIKLLNPPSQQLCIDFFRQVIAVLRSLELKLFTDGILVECTLTLAAFSPDPFQTIVGQELLHLLDLATV